MSWLSSMSTGTDTTFINFNSDASTADAGQYVMTWFGLQNSWADGYEWNNKPDQIIEFKLDTQDFPHKIEWANEHRSWIKVSVGTDNTIWEQTSTADNQFKVFNFYYRWTENYPTSWPNYEHIDNLTVKFSPIVEEQEIAPETFLKWLERLGHDYAFLRMQYRMQKKMMTAVGHLPPWDPRKIEELEQKRIRLRQHFESLEPEALEAFKKIDEQRLKQRWGIEEIPPITPEFLDQIAETSLNFLKECLSPEEQKFFDEYGHCKIRSPNEPKIYYIVKTEQERVERYKEGRLIERICVHSAWGGLPAYDNMAAKILHIKCAEPLFLKEGNRTKVRG